jgi:hypothetical protein
MMNCTILTDSIHNYQTTVNNKVHHNFGVSMNHYSLMCEMLPENGVEFTGQMDWDADSWGEQRELTEQEKEEWYEEPKELTF